MSVQTAGIAPEVARHLDALPEICRRHHVRWLDIFGSAVNGDFDPARSDVDVLLAFDWPSAENAFLLFFELQEALEQLFQRPVDLVTEGSVKNPYLQLSVEASRHRIYP